jgi:hypothetical protein
MPKKYQSSSKSRLLEHAYWYRLGLVLQQYQTTMSLIPKGFSPVDQQCHYFF